MLDKQTDVVSNASAASTTIATSLSKTGKDLCKQLYIQGSRKVSHQKNFTGRAWCREQSEVRYPCTEMNSNVATGTFLCKLGNAATQAFRRHHFCIFCEGSSFENGICLVAQPARMRLFDRKRTGSKLG